MSGAVTSYDRSGISGIFIVNSTNCKYEYSTFSVGDYEIMFAIECGPNLNFSRCWFVAVLICVQAAFAEFVRPLYDNSEFINEVYSCHDVSAFLNTVLVIICVCACAYCCEFFL